MMISPSESGGRIIAIVLRSEVEMGRGSVQSVGSASFNDFVGTAIVG